MKFFINVQLKGADMETLTREKFKRELEKSGETFSLLCDVCMHELRFKCNYVSFINDDEKKQLHVLLKKVNTNT